MQGATMIRALSAAALLLSLQAFAGWTREGEAAVTFNGVGPAGFKLEGKTKQLELKDDGKTLTIVINLKELDTGISMRDSHMRDKYIEVGTFPEATLAVPLASIKVPDDGKSVEVETKGTFTVHGVAKELPFKYTATNKGGVIEIDGKLNLNLKDHGINVPTYLGITVKPDITTHTVFKAKKG
jgi:polyisoprenoid-binding protein YceI